MCYRLEISRAVTELHEKSLVVFESVRRPNHCVVQPIRMEVVHRLSDALLEIGSGNDLQIFAQRQTRLMSFVGGRLNDELEEIDPTLRSAGNHNLVFPPGAIRGEHSANRFVACTITVECLERGSDVEHFVFDSQVLRDLPAA